VPGTFRVFGRWQTNTKIGRLGGACWTRRDRKCRGGCEREGCEKLTCWGLIDLRSRHIDNSRIKNFQDFMNYFSKELPTPVQNYNLQVSIWKVFVRNAASASRTAPSREFGGRVGAWLMDLNQDWPSGIAKHLRWSSAALCSSEPPVWSHFRTIWRFPDQRGSDDGMRDAPETQPDGRFRQTKGSRYGASG
jgi:hypothetical protein